MTGLMGQDNGKDGFDEMKDNRMDNIVEYAYNMDNGYVEVWFTDGNMFRLPYIFPKFGKNSKYRENP